AVEQVGMDAPQAHSASIGGARERNFAAQRGASGGDEAMTTTTTPTPPTAGELMAELADLADPRILAVNERHGDDHAVNLTKLRAVAKRVKKNHPLAVELWGTGDSAARLLALLI